MRNRFEVSGYDKGNRFFVEWSAISAKNHRWTLLLRRRVDSDAWVFVRASNRTLRPIPLQVVDCEAIPGEVMYRVLAIPVACKPRQVSARDRAQELSRPLKSGPDGRPRRIVNRCIQTTPIRPCSCQL
jgi:hypothetical protein